MRDPRQDGRPFATQESANGSSRTSADGDPYRSLVERMPAITYIDAWQGGATVEISPQIERILGFPRQSWVGNEELWSERIHPEDRDRVRAETLVARESGEPYHTEYRMIAADGRVVWFRDEATLVRDQRSNPMFWQGVMLDVTELRRAEEQVHAANERYRALVEQIPAIIYVDVVDEAMTTSYVSPQIEEILGFTPEEYVEDAGLWYEQLHPDDRDRALGEYLAGRDSGQPFTFEYRLLARDGRVVWFRDSAVVLCDHEGRPEFVRGVMLDITEERKAEEEAAFIAYHDKLTGLPNRAMFDELLELALARGRRHGLSVAVLCLDVDDFKLVNDSLGHEAGDQLIRVLGDRLREATRETDLVARQGGDEFLLLLADLEVDTEDGTDPGKLVAESVAMRIQEMLRTPFEVGGTELYVTASIGISLFPGDADTASALLKNAAAALL